MVITGIKKILNTKSRFLIYADEEPLFPLYSWDIKKLNLKEGDEISENVFELARKNALNDALKLISRMDYTEKMIVNKLMEKKYPPEISEYAATYLKEKNYTDDYTYAVRFSKNAFLSKKKGKAYVEAELLRRGIKKDIIEEIINSYYEEESIREVAKKKLNSLVKNGASPQMKDFLKLRDYLLRQGYSYDEIKDIISELRGNYED